MPPVEALDVNVVNGFHHLGKIRQFAVQQKVKMVRHQTVGESFYFIGYARVSQQAQIQAVIRTIEEELVAVIPMGDDMVV